MNKHFISAFICGLIFGMGLLISGMSNPDKVLSFLDLFGNWDPSLMFVMAGAIAVAAVAFTWARGRTLSLFEEPFRLPTKKEIDRRLILGSLGFGVGWGLAGFCPGPAIAALGTAASEAVVFVSAMLIGMIVYDLIERTRERLN